MDGAVDAEEGAESVAERADARDEREEGGGERDFGSRGGDAGDEGPADALGAGDDVWVSLALMECRGHIKQAIMQKKEQNSHEEMHAVHRAPPGDEGGVELGAVDGDACGVEGAVEVGAHGLVVVGSLDEGRGKRGDDTLLRLKRAARREDGVPGRDKDGGGDDDAAELNLSDREAVDVEEEGLGHGGLGHHLGAREERDHGRGVDEGEGLRPAGDEFRERNRVGRHLARHSGVDARLRVGMEEAVRRDASGADSNN